MSEQKMPALPEPDVLIAGFLPMYRTAAVERIRAEAIEFGRQHERERLEPLRAAVEDYHAERRHGTTNSEIDAAFELYNAARALLEPTR